MFLLVTPRLHLREFTVEDARDIHLLNLDPEVIRYTGDAPFPSVAAAAKFLEGYDHYRRYGHGRWAVELRENGTFLGWCGLKYTPELDEHDIGFRFMRVHWGKGYATEAALACLGHGFEVLGLTTVVGRAMKANAASIRVMEKMGMQYVGPYDFEGEDGVLYRSARDRWNAPAW